MSARRNRSCAGVSLPDTVTGPVKVSNSCSGRDGYRRSRSARAGRRPRADPVRVVGVVDGGRGRRSLVLSTSTSSAPASDDSPSGCCHHRHRSSTDGHPPPGRRRDRAGVQPAQRAHRDGHRAGRRRRRARRGQARHPRAWHTPSEVKAAVSGNGNADKAQVTAMVTRILATARRAETGGRRRRTGAGHLPLWRAPMTRGWPPRRPRRPSRRRKYQAKLKEGAR